MRPPPPSTPKPSRRRKWLRRVVEPLLIIGLLLGVRAWQQRNAVSGPAPRLQGTAVTGEPLSLEALRGGPVLVHFWATWCSVCDTVKGSIDAIAHDYAVISVAEDSGQAAELHAWMERQGISFPTIADSGGLSRAFGVQAFPTDFVIGPDGRIRFVEVGYSSELGLRARLALAARW
ncbi:MAG: redoxin domain-containing protein [Deltaproteobacteria bacterium]|nr:redoxin domain-containing protein [Deltaproteobacteria bacterium]